MEERFYSVKEISQKFGINEETVRRWIRSRKIETKTAKLDANKNGWEISETSLMKFLKNYPKYAVVAASVLGPVVGPIAATAGGIAGGIISHNYDKSSIEDVIAADDIETMLRQGIEEKQQELNKKKIEIARLQGEIEVLEREFKNNMDLLNIHLQKTEGDIHDK